MWLVESECPVLDIELRGGDIVTIRAVTQRNFIEFRDRMEVIQIIAEQNASRYEKFSDLYEADKHFAYCCDRVLFFHGIEGDEITFDVFERLVIGDGSKPGLLLLLNAPKRKGGESSPKVEGEEERESSGFDLPASLIGLAGFEQAIKSMDLDVHQLSGLIGSYARQQKEAQIKSIEDQIADLYAAPSDKSNQKSRLAEIEQKKRELARLKGIDVRKMHEQEMAEQQKRLEALNF